ncbi:protein unc-13 homolog isoform X1 [Rhododendron vialii]|uniref:protein unc-13 homolog isoform X1 n=1 Tax=Rhododendron vialii TaxID=182163 RepID=UPI00265D7E53|nr:protein unc-13 homolog isoform X1 [Rhododendron vialii]XP_058226010.1 protein unc-13 homolog isoform X1 [Rhododendron vialii]XP_058226011.1 protein unc-13 homolog isoform X1 [Rhododendron vialii]XP_058226012.1 protein unc-13 homolog isoform X1 [Rhododendron vialii]XP_058226013.1 protein unc-13 homolog isoform X1 [Rhododendron vialii]XP_058226014.1 protein unc-13 homolog isoform X1 [Rhododendron vialii]XP_058226016.1 protein unc-13 homolog isoform X1 [Rhododendron vialii]
MEEENAVELLQRFRRDRRILLDYILSGSFIKKVVMPPGAVSLDDVDLDQVSVDYVLSCAKKGGMLELSEAIRDYHDNTLFPHMNNMGSTDEFFLVTTPDLSGLPPKRAPPPVPMFTPSPILPSLSKSVSLISTHEEESPESTHVEESLNSTQVQELSVDDIEDFEDDDDLEEVESRRTSRRIPNDASDLAPGLSSFATGISDDDLRETAYEILLAAAGASGGLIVPTKEKKKEKRSRFMRKLGRGKSEHAVNQSQHSTGLVGLLETMRVQMEISEAMDIRSRQGMLNAMVGRVGKRMDTLLIPLELLCCISRTEFPDKKAYIRWQKRQLNMLEEGLINHPAVGFGESGRKASELRILLAKIEECEFLPSSMGELQRTECLRSLREIVIPLAERPARGDLTGEVSHWADGYHLNVRLYEKLLLSVFDVLDEGKLTEEVEEILELLKSTWRILGITETIHSTCYAWVLFRQFVITSEQGMLQHAIEQLNKIPMKEQRGQQERLHLKSLLSRVEREEGVREFTFLQSFLSPIKKWADKQLGDYHLHFSEDSALMEGIVAVSMLSRRLLLEEPEMALQSVTDKDQIETYISLSLKTAFTRALHEVETVADATNEHPLALLAEQSKKLLQKEATMFMPILSQRHPQAIVVSASLLHRLYGNKLKPFINGAEHLTEDVVSVFPAADSLEQHVMTLIMSVYEETTAEAHFRKLTLYKIETVSGTLVLRWVNAQLGRILGWVERAIQQEHWDPVSPQQRHGSSIVEVYRIVEETVDQFFALKVPMRLGEMNSLFRGIDNAFQVYAKHVVDKIASKEDLIPPVPILTRHKKELGIKAFVKRELHDPRLPDVRTSTEITVLTTPTLCVQLNTLHYGISQLNKLEDSIWDRWTRKRTQEKLVKRSIDENSRSSMQKDTFDGSRKDFNVAIDRLCEFTGTKIVFWDLREPFIDNLYKPSVPQSRMEGLIEPLDMALNQLCDIIVEALRDRVVTGLLQASLDGLLRVILDGGPSRVFSPGDAKLLEEDVEVLKEFFISGGDGLPRGVVENQVARVRQVVKLHGYETRELIEDIKSASGVGMQSGRSKLGADTNTLLRILCHRSDSEASQFLKKQFKIPKSAA